MEGSNPQDIIDLKPDHSRQDLSCLGQAIRGPVRPGEKHETGSILDELVSQAAERLIGRVFGEWCHQLFLSRELSNS